MVAIAVGLLKKLLGTLLGCHLTRLCLRGRLCFVLCHRNTCAEDQQTNHGQIDSYFSIHNNGIITIQSILLQGCDKGNYFVHTLCYNPVIINYCTLFCFDLFFYKLVTIHATDGILILHVLSTFLLSISLLII